MANLYDPRTGEKLKQAPPQPSARQMLYHPETEPIVVSVESTELHPLSMAQCAAMLKDKIKEKLEEGYLVDRPHGQHPHSNDRHRLQQQTRDAKNGDKKAASALQAKKNIAAKKAAPEVSEEVASETAAMRKQFDELQAEVKRLQAAEKGGKQEPKI